MPLIRPGRNVPLKALLKRFALIYSPTVVVLSTALLFSVQLDEQRQVLLVIVYLFLALASWIVAIVTLSREQARFELAKSKTRYDELVRSIPVGVYLFRFHDGSSMAFEYVSPVFCQLLGLDADAVLSDASIAFAAVHPDDMERLLRSNQEVAVSLKPFRWEGRFIVRGETRWLRIASDPTQQNGEGSLWGGVVSDITDSKLAEQILALHAELVQQMAEGMVLIRASDGMILFANMAFERMFGYGPGELVGKQVAILNAQTDKTPEEIAKLITETLRQTSLWSGEIENVKKDGMRFWSLANVSTFVHPQYGEVWLSIHQDITERKKMENELERQARIDMLTGLNNRRHFFELAERELARAKRHGEPLSALMLDADHFKLFNDNYGHHIGDMVLQKLSEVCAQVLRENDILGRIGGEEFAILLPETDGSQALDAAERLRQAVANAEVQFAPDELIRFTVSIGVTSLVATDAKVDTLLKRSDEALYEAKNAGRNLVRVK